MRDMGYGMEGWARQWSMVCLLMTLVCLLLPRPSRAQTVVEVLQQQRRDARVAEVLAERGDRLAPRPLAELGTVDRWTRAFLAVEAGRQAAVDSARAAEEARADSAILAARLNTLRWRKVEPGAQGSFLEQYRETYWLAAQPQRGLVTDTSATADLRGLLQAAFGDPTRNGDAQKRHGYGGSEFIQFEYWFVVNDSIPMLALDVDGPFGRGLLIASDETYAPILPALKADLSRRLAAARRPDPWLDYYHSYERGQWFRTGYNGEVGQYAVPVRAPRWAGRDSERWVIHR